MEICTIIAMIVLWIVSLIACWFEAKNEAHAAKNVTGGKSIHDARASSQTINFLRQNWEPFLGNCRTCVDWKDIPKKLPYQPTKNILRTTMHNGQVKLLLTEIEFLTDTLSKDEPAIMVYAGSAPSHKYPFLRAMFPQVKFVMVDPHEHHFIDGDQDQYDIPNDYLYFIAAGNDSTEAEVTTVTGMAPKEHTHGKMINLHGEGLVPRTASKQGKLPDDLATQIEAAQQKTIVIEDYMTDHLAALLEPLRKHHKLLFVSDIRTRLDESDPLPSDLDVIWNSAMMYNWIAIMKPARYMLKFRTPFGRDKEKLAADYAAYPICHQAITSCPIKFLENFAKDPNCFTYLHAEHIWLQAFPGVSSTETRLVGSTLDTTQYDCNEYDDRLFYYNRIYRSFGHHPEAADIVCETYPTDFCADCALCSHILTAYMTKHGPSKYANTRDMLGAILKAISRDLRGDLHGYGHEATLEGWVNLLKDCS